MYILSITEYDSNHRELTIHKPFEFERKKDAEADSVKILEELRKDRVEDYDVDYVIEHWQVEYRIDFVEIVT